MWDTSVHVGEGESPSPALSGRSVPPGQGEKTTCEGPTGQRYSSGPRRSEPITAFPFTQCIAAACDTWQDMPQRQGAEFEDIKPAWGADRARMLRWWGWEFHTTEWGQGEEPVRTAVTDGGGRDARRRTSGCGFGTYCGGAAEQFYWWLGSNLWQKQRRTGVMPRFWPEQSNDGNGHLLKGATSARNRVLCEEGGSFTFIWALLPRYVSR